jgi:spore germination cell wall hydrolase CwlJ-like protein
MILLGALIPRASIGRRYNKDAEPPIIDGTSSNTSGTTITTPTGTQDTEATEEKVEYNPPFELSEADRKYITLVILAEARGESIIGQMAIAQCILDGAIYYNTDPVSLCKKLGYAAPWDGSGVDEDRYTSLYNIASNAVARVFDEGARAIYSRVIFFYAPKRCESTWHESQNYVATIGSHKFFDIREADHERD